MRSADSSKLNGASGACKSECTHQYMVHLTILSVEQMIQALIRMNIFLLELKNNHVLVRYKQLNRSVKVKGRIGGLSALLP